MLIATALGDSSHGSRRPLNAAFSLSVSRCLSLVRSFMLTPARFSATWSRVPERSYPQPCGRLTTPRLTSLVSSTGTVTMPTFGSQLRYVSSREAP